MSPKRRKRAPDDPLEPYRRVRKAVPRPGRPIPDRRDKLAERDERRRRREEGEQEDGR
ncbi:MAG TPA: hypothetical protein VEO00_04625 [Actinomycetota bacterium]|nr:hypothetical protein [Actinomycetota bacterium]